MDAELKAKMQAGRKAKTASKPQAGHTVRTADGGTKTFAKLSRAMAVKLFCSECMGWETHPKDCTAIKCALFPFRGLTLAGKHKDAEG